MDSVSGSKSLLQASDEVFDFECGLCLKEGKRREAKSYCKDCKTYICVLCINTHSRSQALRSHKMIQAAMSGLYHVDARKRDAKYASRGYMTIARIRMKDFVCYVIIPLCLVMSAYILIQAVK